MRVCLQMASASLIQAMVISVDTQRRVGLGLSHSQGEAASCLQGAMRGEDAKRRVQCLATEAETAALQHIQASLHGHSTRHTLQHWQSIILARAWRQLRYVVCSSIHTKQVATHALKHMKNRGLAAAFLKWQAATRQALADARQMQHVVLRMLHTCMAVAFVHWKELAAMCTAVKFAVAIQLQAMIRRRLVRRAIGIAASLEEREAAGCLQGAIRGVSARGVAGHELKVLALST
jgi:hypothetical protein